MHSDDENISHTTLSELCSINDKLHHRDKDHRWENECLKKEVNNLTKMNVDLSHRLEKADAKAQKLNEEIQRIEIYYKTVISNLKKQLKSRNDSHKRNYHKISKSNENLNPNIMIHQKDMKQAKKQVLKSQIVPKRQQKNEENQHRIDWKKTALERTFNLHTKIKSLTLNEAFGKCKSIIEETQQKSGIENDEDFSLLKTKVNHLRDTPLSVDLYSQKNLHEMENMMTCLDIQLNILKGCGRKI